VKRALGPPAVQGGARLAAVVCATLFLTAAAPGDILLREQAWTPAGETLARDMIVGPGECVAAQTAETEIGRTLFRSPALLGGPAARAGLSCNACHTNGRTNARFNLPELTNVPGHADVSSEWSSKVRGDGVMNPVPIPDLAGVGARETFGHLHDPSLDHFTHSVVTEEFQGAEPRSQAMAGVIAYLRALDAGACSAEHRITLASAADDVRRALAAAETADAPTARLLLLAAQDAMGRIAERLPARRFGTDRGRFERLSRELGRMRRDDVHTLMAETLPGWRVRFDAAVARVARRERRTYFHEATLRAALQD
jgi:hypothetical protein